MSHQSSISNIQGAAIALQEKVERARSTLQKNGSLPTNSSEKSMSEPLCEHCRGTGYYQIEKPGEPPFQHYLYLFTIECECKAVEKAQKRQSAMFTSAGIPERHQGFSFETFKQLSAEQREGKMPAATLCWQIAQQGAAMLGDFIEKHGVVMSGPCGIGKTGLAAAAALERMSNGNPVLWVDYNGMIRDVQKTYAPDYSGPTAEDITGAAATAGFLVLDDMGDVASNREVSDDRRNITYEIIRRRHERLLPTILTTNLDQVQFEYQFGTRISQRVRELCFWTDMTGKILRQL